MKYGLVIKETRKKKNFSQGEFARRLGITQSYLSLVEGGKKTPSLEMIERIAELLEVPVYYFMFKGLEVEKDISEEKRDTYKRLSPYINSMVEELFLNQEK